MHKYAPHRGGWHGSQPRPSRTHDITNTTQYTTWGCGTQGRSLPQARRLLFAAGDQCKNKQPPGEHLAASWPRQAEQVSAAPHLPCPSTHKTAAGRKNLLASQDSMHAPRTCSARVCPTLVQQRQQQRPLKLLQCARTGGHPPKRPKPAHARHHHHTKCTCGTLSLLVAAVWLPTAPA